MQGGSRGTNGSKEGEGGATQCKNNKREDGECVLSSAVNVVSGADPICFFVWADEIVAYLSLAPPTPDLLLSVSFRPNNLKECERASGLARQRNRGEKTMSRGRPAP